jgi:hypothetical protein
MSVIRSVPSQVDPNGIDELIADAQRIALPRQHSVDLTRIDHPDALVIPPASVTLVEGYDDYGV